MEQKTENKFVKTLQRLENKKVSADLAIGDRTENVVGVLVAISYTYLNALILTPEGKLVLLRSYVALREA